MQKKGGDRAGSLVHRVVSAAGRKAAWCSDDGLIGGSRSGARRQCA